jgi:hypothetical protein
MMRGAASANIESGSALGVNPAMKRQIPNIQIRHGRKIVLPDKNPIALKVTKKTGSSNAIPKRRITRNTKSR